MKLNYPIKYAAMPVEYPEEYYDVSFFGCDEPYKKLYIVSKCYQISKKEHNLQNGTTKMEYEVVFPYQQVDKMFQFERREPTYGIKRCNNSVILEGAFDCYEDALKEAERLNQKKLIECFQEVNYDSQKEKRTRQLREIALKEYKKYEKLIEENTNDLLLEKEIKEQSFIRINKKKDKVEIWDMSIYEYFLLSNDWEYVYHVSKEEYQKMKEQIKKLETLDQKYFNPVMSNELKCLAIFNPQKRNMPFFNYDFPLEKGGFCRKGNYLTEESMEYDETLPSIPQKSDYDLLESGVIIYTLESYQDILQAYLPVYYQRPGIIIDGKPMQYLLPWKYESVNIKTKEEIKQKCKKKTYISE